MFPWFHRYLDLSYFSKYDQDMGMCMQACTHASVHANYFLVCLGPYLSQIRYDQGDQSI